MSAQLAHDLGPYGLKFFSFFCGQEQTPELIPFQFQNLKFKNRLGIAGGVDKGGDSLTEWSRLGCGFLELGTVTPEPQKPNPGPIMGRDLKTQSVWNKMGFPSEGAEEALLNLRRFKTHFHEIPVFINLGKNRLTPNDRAHEDYLKLLQTFKSDADAFVINLSSPNTKGLRDLTSPQYFERFLKPLFDYKTTNLAQPLLFKLSPDMNETDLRQLVTTLISYGADGFIITNTTVDRSLTPFYPNEGGVSGLPLKKLSISALKTVVSLCNNEKSKKLIISAGGVMTADDVFERIQIGADLVQCYSALIFEGPLFFRKVLNSLNDRKSFGHNASKTLS